ncbi:hypothetical protein OS493_021051 [Desmophyllum pertusum]|uniref:phosphoethanolamine N-methyltransferase n=1 Tax=Desmophyllum pertusum TaxID=174260 RepID=A0A9X0A119_9CNID|nr:hypothetical protein OS493_021051 [Desmophyllum pertusum]
MKTLKRVRYNLNRETILHIKDKKSLFQKILRWLKPGGQLLITDYCFYGKILREVGFEAVTAEDRTTQFGQIIESELKNFEQSKDKFVKDFSSEDYSAIAKSWTNKLSRCRGGEQTWGVFYARKPISS